MTMTTKNPTYTDDQVSKMVEVYTDASNDTDRTEVVQTLAQEFSKSVASIRSKLVREGVYVAKTRVSKTGAPVINKADIVNQIADEIGVDAETFESLEKATKPVLTKLLNFLQA